MPEIKWMDWGKAAFDKARSDQKPVLLDIFGSWCHWCHVMDNTSYSDPAVVDLVNKHFIPVRVDTDKRPDVNRRYNMGGWPSTVFLDGEGRIITGGTYIPPGQMRDALRSVTDLYERTKGKVRSKMGPRTVPKPTGEELSDRILKDISTTAAVNFDIDYGGFGFEPKFPHTDALELALLRYHYIGEKEMYTVVSRTLDHMGKGGTYDHVEGGFFRYSTTRDWSIPHYEKMAEDNAKLLSVYLKAFQLTGNPYYKEVAEGIIRFVDAYLVNPEKPGFYGSQDADEEYYKMGLDARKKKDAPRVDKTLYTNYNALFVSAYLLAGTVLKKPKYTQRALQTLDHVLDRNVKEDILSHYDRDDSPRGLLVDQALVTLALLDAYEQTGLRKYVEAATRLIKYILANLQDPQDGGFYDIPTAEDLGELRNRDKPLDENGLVAVALMRLSHVTSDEGLFEAAGKALKVFTGDYERYGLMAASYAVALDFFLNGPVGLTIVGPEKSKEFLKFKQEALNVYPGRRAILYLDPATDAKKIKTLGYSLDAVPSAYVCIGKVCGLPMKQPSELKESVASLVKSATVPALS